MLKALQMQASSAPAHKQPSASITAVRETYCCEECKPDCAVILAYRAADLAGLGKYTITSRRQWCSHGCQEKEPKGVWADPSTLRMLFTLQPGVSLPRSCNAAVRSSEQQLSAPASVALMREPPYTVRAVAERLNQNSELTCSVASTCRPGGQARQLTSGRLIVTDITRCRLLACWRRSAMTCVATAGASRQQRPSGQRQGLAWSAVCMYVPTHDTGAGAAFGAAQGGGVKTHEHVDEEGRWRGMTSRIRTIRKMTSCSHTTEPGWSDSNRPR
jgi:hypothetical protein